MNIKPQKWLSTWYEVNSTRVMLEVEAMNERFPSFTLRRIDNGSLCWDGTLETDRGNTYRIIVVYPDNFPSASPNVYPIEPAVSDGKHQYADGRLCLFYPNDRTLDQNSTAATSVAISAAWFFAYESWLESGRKDWPGKEAD